MSNLMIFVTYELNKFSHDYNSYPTKVDNLV
jgi:hypothetical protein